MTSASRPPDELEHLRRVAIDDVLARHILIRLAAGEMVLLVPVHIKPKRIRRLIRRAHRALTLVRLEVP